MNINSKIDEIIGDDLPKICPECKPPVVMQTKSGPMYQEPSLFGFPNILILYQRACPNCTFKSDSILIHEKDVQRLERSEKRRAYWAKIRKLLTF